MRDVVGLVVTNVVVMIGWVIIFRQTLKVKYRDDVRKVVDLAADLISDIYDGCCTYYSDANAGHINHISVNIRAKFVLLSHYLLMLRDSGISSGVSGALIQYKIHAMGGYFETTDYLKQAKLPNWKVELASSAQEPRFRLEKGYFELSRRSAGKK